MSNVVAYLKYNTNIYNLYFPIMLLNTFVDNITKFVSSISYHEYFLI